MSGRLLTPWGYFSIWRAIRENTFAEEIIPKNNNLCGCRLRGCIFFTRGEHIADLEVTRWKIQHVSSQDWTLFKKAIFLVYFAVQPENYAIHLNIYGLLFPPDPYIFSDLSNMLKDRSFSKVQNRAQFTNAILTNKVYSLDNTWPSRCQTAPQSPKYPWLLFRYQNVFNMLTIL